MAYISIKKEREREREREKKLIRSASSANNADRPTPPQQTIETALYRISVQEKRKNLFEKKCDFLVAMTAAMICIFWWNLSNPIGISRPSPDCQYLTLPTFPNFIALLLLLRFYYAAIFPLFKNIYIFTHTKKLHINLDEFLADIKRGEGKERKKIGRPFLIRGLFSWRPFDVATDRVAFIQMNYPPETPTPYSIPSGNLVPLLHNNNKKTQPSLSFNIYSILLSRFFSSSSALQKHKENQTNLMKNSCPIQLNNIPIRLLLIFFFFSLKRKKELLLLLFAQFDGGVVVSYAYR